VRGAGTATDSLVDDRYVFIEREQALVGMRRRQRFRLGDRVQVEAVHVSLQPPRDRLRAVGGVTSWRRPAGAVPRRRFGASSPPSPSDNEL